MKMVMTMDKAFLALTVATRILRGHQRECAVPQHGVQLGGGGGIEVAPRLATQIKVVKASAALVAYSRECMHDFVVQVVAREVDLGQARARHGG